MEMQEKWRTSCYESGNNYLPNEISNDKEWIARNVKIQKEHVEYWKDGLYNTVFQYLLYN